ncbi:hypothetical protein [Bradyrhizobium sp. LVM 105]|uniref:hypothetical protein n=1 Tax=Bradyrhizobium sp. LVM 105 TaxID=2341115 RepID=UPI000F81041C|nr:hypothetical protein [Bradyrhizobium sp. LVM 105]
MTAAILAVVLLQTLEASARSSAAYKCTVKNAYALKDGKLVPHQLLSSFVNKEFVVDRANGRMLGTFSSALWETVKVLDAGSREQSFKAIYVSGGFVQVRLLVIREFDTSTSKDFTIAENDDVLTGICTHLD